MMLNRFKPKEWEWRATTLCTIALIFFAAGFFLTFRWTRIGSVKADSDRVFELRIYHTVPGKLPVMESRFRNTTSKLLAKHNITVLGYWKGEDALGSANSFVFLLAHQNWVEAKKNWEAMGMDPDFQLVEKAELSEKTLETPEVIYMRPEDFSQLK